MQIFLFVVGSVLTIAGGLTLFSHKFNVRMNATLWKDPAKPDASKADYRFNRYVRGVVWLLIGIMLLVGFWASFY